MPIWLFIFLFCIVSPAAVLAADTDDLIPPPLDSAEDEATRSIQKNPDKNYISLSVENDSLGGGTDQYYTSGVRLTYFNVNTQVPRVFETLDDDVPGVDINETTSTFYSIGHNIYTPEDISIEQNQSKDRPWAAFLYGSVGMVTALNHHIDELEATIGVVGPEALGKPIQRFVHNHVITSATNPRGWDNQLKFEPGLILSWDRRWPTLLAYDVGDYRFRAVPNVNLSLGNIYTYAGTGVMFTFGPYKGYLQDTPPRVRPAPPGSGYFEVPDQDWSWYTFAGADGRAMARNIFLDGNTFEDSPSVDKKTFVGDLTAGLALAIGDYRLTYSVNMRSKEFYGQDDTSVFGALTLTTKF